jgi:hypothetical protein
LRDPPSKFFCSGISLCAGPTLQKSRRQHGVTPGKWAFEKKLPEPAASAGLPEGHNHVMQMATIKSIC